MRVSNVQGGVVAWQDERRSLRGQLLRCVTETFFVLLVAAKFKPGDLVSGIVVLDIDAPLAVDEIVVSVRARSQVRRAVCAAVRTGLPT